MKQFGSLLAALVFLMSGMNRYQKCRQGVLFAIRLCNIVGKVKGMLYRNYGPIAPVQFFIRNLSDAVLVNTDVIPNFGRYRESDNKSLAVFGRHMWLCKKHCCDNRVFNGFRFYLHRFPFFVGCGLKCFLGVPNSGKGGLPGSQQSHGSPANAGNDVDSPT